MTTWIIAADASRARILERIPGDERLREVTELANPEGRASHRELTTGPQGRHNRYGHAAGPAQHNTAEPRQDAVDHDVELFSKEVCRFLEKARTDQRYDRLCLVAPPKFLGLLRSNLSKDARRLVAEEIDEDLAGFEFPKLERHLMGHFRDSHPPR